jgi:hypothetical protein
MRLVSQQRLPIEHERIMFLHSQVPRDMFCIVLRLLLLVRVASMAIIVLRSSWPWGLEGLFAPPQALELAPARTREAVVCQYRMGSSTIPRAVFDMCRRLHLSSRPSQDFQCCLSCQHRHSCTNLILSFSIISDSDFQIPAHPSLALTGQDQEECHRQSLLSNPFSSSDDGTRRRAWDCL